MFLQLHLFLGYFLGSAAVRIIHAATAPMLAALAVIAAVGVVCWFARRGRRLAAGGLAGAACPACLAIAYLAEQPGDLEMLAHDEGQGPCAGAANPKRGLVGGPGRSFHHQGNRGRAGRAGR